MTSIASRERALTLCRSVSVVGDTFSFVVVPMLLVESGWSALGLGLMYTILGAVQGVASGYFAQMVNRWDPVVVHRTGLVVAAISQIVFLAVVADGHASFWPVLASKLLYGSVGSINNLSLQLASVRIYGANRVQAFNSRTRTVRAAAMFIFPLLIGLAPTSRALWLALVAADIVSFLVGAMLVPSDSGTPETKPTAGDAQDRNHAGIADVLRSANWFVPLVMTSMAYCLVILPIITVVSGPYLGSAGQLRHWSLYLGLRGGGTIVGGVLARRIPPRPAWLALSLCAECGVLLVLFEPTAVVLLAVAFFICGMAESVFNVIYTTFVQTQSRDAYLPRLMSIDGVVASFAIPVGSLVCGFMAVNTTAMVSFAGAVIAAGVVAGACAQLRSRGTTVAAC